MGSGIADTLKVAVVMPVYNSREYLTEAVNSVLRQKYRNFILVAVDDGSTDGSLEILNRIERRTDHLVVISKNNGGVSSARNVALEYIEKSGDFDAVCFCDSDDVVTDNFIETFVRLMEKYEADYVVSSVFRWFKNLDCPLSVGGERSFALSSNDEAFLHFLGDPLFKKKAPASVSGLITNRCYRLLSIRGLRFREDLSSAEDQEFALRVFKRIKKGVVTEAVTYVYRQRKGSLVRSAGSLNSNIKYVRELIELWEKEKGGLKQAFALYIIHFWWGLVVKTYRKKGERKNKEALREVFNVIERRRMSKNVSLKYKKRLFIFGFGDMIVQLYFRLKFSKTREMVYFE